MSEHEDYQNLLNRMERGESKEKLKSLKEEIFEDIYEDKKSVVKQKIEREGKHLELIKSISSAFIPEGETAKESGYNFLFTEPLAEKGEPNFDCLLYNQNSESVCLIECKSSLNKRKCKQILDDVEKAIKSSKENENYLERQIGDDISHFDYVLMMSPADSQEFRAYCDENEHYVIPKISLWVPDFFEENRINLEKDFENHDHADLNKCFSKGGIQFNQSRTNIDIIYKSHTLTYIKQTLMEIILENMKEDREQVKEFEKERISGALNKMLKIGPSGSNKNGIIEEKTNMIVEKSKKLNIIKEGKKEDYRIVSRYENISGIRDDIEEKYISNKAERLAEDEAKENAVKRFKKEKDGTQSGLNKYSN